MPASSSSHGSTNGTCWFRVPGHQYLSTSIKACVCPTNFQPQPNLSVPAIEERDTLHIDTQESNLKMVVVLQPLPRLCKAQLESHLWWHLPAIPALERWKQKDPEFKAILTYTASSRPAWATQSLVKKKKEERRRRRKRRRRKKKRKKEVRERRERKKEK